MLFAAAVFVAALGHLLVNPLMANDRVFGRDPWATVALFLPALAALAFLHVAVPRDERASVLKYGLRVVVASVLAYAVAVVILIVAVVALTGEFI